jgi:hypothetical protein
MLLKRTAARSHGLARPAPACGHGTREFAKMRDTDLPHPHNLVKAAGPPP